MIFFISFFTYNTYETKRENIRKINGNEVLRIRAAKKNPLASRYMLVPDE